MTKLYIANCTKQVIDFLYRVPESARVHQQTIGIGQQVMVYKESARADEIDYIIGQHARFGLVRESEIDRTKVFIGMCYSVGQPVNMERVQSALEHNDEVLTEVGAQTRLESAVALNDSLERSTGKDGGLRHVDVEITEVPKPNDDNDKPRLKETVHVSKDVTPSESLRSAGKRNKSR